MKGTYIGAPDHRDYAWCQTEKVWHAISDEDDVKTERQRAERSEQAHRAHAPVGSRIAQ